MTYPRYGSNSDGSNNVALTGSKVTEEKILDNYEISAGATYRWGAKAITNVEKACFGVIQSVAHSCVFAWEPWTSDNVYLGQPDSKTFTATGITDIWTSRSLNSQYYLKNNDTSSRTYTVWRYDQEV